MTDARDAAELLRVDVDEFARPLALVADDRLPGFEGAQMAAIVALALQYGRYGYRRIAALLRRDGWTVNVKRVERIWRRQGLKVPARQPSSRASG